MEDKREVRETKSTPANEKPEAPEIAQRSRFLRWLDNFWYHYKWQTIAVAFVLIVLGVCFGQCSSVQANKGDITVAFGGAGALSDSEQHELQKILGDLLPEDYDGNGTKTTAFAQFSIFTEKELEQLYTFYDEEDQTYKVDRSSLSGARHYNTERIQNLQNYIMTGECAVWFISPYVYETMFEGKVNVEETAQLKDTALYQYYDVIKLLPEETLIVLTRPVMGNMSKSENYQRAVDYYHAILSFTAP